MKRKMSLLSLICLFTNILMAQTRITGTVTDVDKNPLPGVSVVCKSTSQGTVTDIDGYFKQGVACRNAGTGHKDS